MRQRAQQLATEISRRPLASVGICLAVGYFAGKLPLLRFLGGTARAALPLAPSLLAIVGAARVWDLLAPPDIDSPRDKHDESDQLNHLLAMQLSSLESYNLATARFDGDDRRVLDHVRAVHAEIARQLSEAIKADGASPSSVSNPWEGLSRALAQPGGRLADLPLFSMMLTAEENAVRTFEAALDEPSLGEDHKNMIRRHLLPRARENVTSLLRHKSQRETAPSGV